MLNMTAATRETSDRELHNLNQSKQSSIPRQISAALQIDSTSLLQEH